MVRVINMSKIKLYDDLFYLVLNDVVLFTTYDEETGQYLENYISPFLNCGDTFHYATADAEGFKLEHSSYIRELYDRFDYDGLVAWIATKRKQEPIAPCCTDTYKIAMQWIVDNPFVYNPPETLETLTNELLDIFETIETTDEGREFHPTTISSCRTMTCVRLEKLMKKISDALGRNSNLKINKRTSSW